MLIKEVCDLEPNTSSSDSSNFVVDHEYNWSV